MGIGSCRRTDGCYRRQSTPRSLGRFADDFHSGKLCSCRICEGSRASATAFDDSRSVERHPRSFWRYPTSLGISIASIWESLSTIKKVRRLSSPEFFADDVHADGKALVKLVAPETLRVARDEKAAAILAKANRKAENTALEESKRRDKLEQGRQPPQEMFRSSTDLYSAWDENGLPTKDAEGADLPKSKSKKLLKDWQRQEQAHRYFLSQQE